jgi:hypothetical protein
MLSRRRNDIQSPLQLIGLFAKSVSARKAKGRTYFYIFLQAIQNHLAILAYWTSGRCYLETEVAGAFLAYSSDGCT